MKKAKLGISIGLLGAGMFWLACINIIPAVLLALYVLLKEDDEWLRKAAVKMMIVCITFGLLSVGVGMIQDAINALNSMVHWLQPIRTIVLPLNIDTVAQYAIQIIEDLVLIGMGFQAYHLSAMKNNYMDTIIENHM